MTSARSVPDPDPRPLDWLIERGEAEAHALVLREKVLTFQEARDRVGAFASWLSQNLAKGDRVASWVAKTELACLMPLAAARAGVVHVPINPLLKRAQVAHILADCGARMLIGTKARMASLEDDDTPADCVLLTEEEAWSSV
ncbi:MAG: AMP-binding protein, partial [Erythrobacter sp.]|nr:AMP-binding protein [Erythrobacter sp.]